MSNTTAVKKGKDVYDPTKKFGLKPEPSAASGTGATYMVSGHVVRGSGSGDASDLFISENMGREAQAKASRKLASVDEEKALLKGLQGRDKDGMKAVMKARQAGRRLLEGKEIKGSKGKKRGKEKEVEEKDEEEEEEEEAAGTRSYSASVIKDLGFDPVAAKLGHRNSSAAVQAKVCMPCFL